MISFQSTNNILISKQVPVVWGTYGPVVKLLYEIDPPIPGLVFSTAYFFVASVSAFTLLATSNEEKSRIEERSLISVIAGIELGAYLFGGNTLQVIGLTTVPSQRAGFLVQTTTILVPILQALSTGKSSNVPVRTWIACTLAIAGITVMGIDDFDFHQMQSLDVRWPSSGDVLILAAALLYSLHVVRLDRWASEVPPLQLVTYKATTELVLGVGVITLLMGAAGAGFSDTLPPFIVDTGKDISSFFASVSQQVDDKTLSTASVWKAVAATLWTGLISTAYTTYAQSFGQRNIKPADANLIYSLQPLFTAAFAFLLLGETMNESGFAGSILLGVAVYLVASQPT